MTSSIYHPLTAFYFIIVAVIWCSAAVTRRFADHSYFAFSTSVLLFSLTDSMWGSVICGQIVVPLAVRHFLCDLFFSFLVLSVVTLGHYLARRLPDPVPFRSLFAAVAAASVVGLVVNHWVPILFTVPAAGSYVTGPLYPVFFFGILALYTALLIPTLFARSHDNRERAMLFIAYVLPVGLTALQFSLPDFPFFGMGFVLDLVGTALIVEYQQRKLLADALAAAEHANKAKTIFLNNMSHDIRTPMNAILGFTALAAAHTDDPDLVQDYLHKIATSGQHLLSLINDVLDMSRIESGRVQIENKEVHLPDVLHDLRTIVNASILAKNLEFFIDAVDVRNEDVLCDKLRLNQMLLNLLSNAIKYTPSGGRVSVRVIQKPCSRAGCAAYEFHVKDNGIGMSNAFQKHLFEPFSREETATVSGIQGTGLGMAITKNIVDMMGGTITVDSQPGHGTEYTVSLTFQLAGGPVQYQIVPQLQGMRVLVADDDSNTAISVSRMVQQIGMRADWTLSGKEAVLRTQAAQDQHDPFGAYIIDWLMPDLNGIETVRRIRHIIGDEKPIIVLTAYDWSDIEQEAREAGVTAFCAKPLFPSELRDVLSKPFQTPEPQPAAPRYDFTGRRILLVEDNPLNQQIAQEVLEQAGFAVDTANDGDVAVETLRNARPGQYDLVLMDIQMPRMDGYTATRQIRTLDSPLANVPIVAMTANAFAEDKRKALEAGMNDHIAKPIEVPRLLSTLKQLLG